MATKNTDSKGRVRTWLKPDQVHAMRDACQSTHFQPYLRDRNETLIAFLYDTGLRVNELTQIKVDYLDLDENQVQIPAHIQKQYPTDRSPATKTMTLAEDPETRDTATRLRSYLTTRWKESPGLFPSRQSDQMTTQAVRNLITKAAGIAQIDPEVDYSDMKEGIEPSVTPHSFRHSVAYRMLQLNSEKYDFYDVRNRLRHSSIITTERIYDHFDVI